MSNGRILAVDDNPDNLMILQELLGDSYLLETAASGEEALRLAPIFRPDLVLLDVMMPGLDGYETCESLRQHADLRDAKIIMLSARIEVNDRLEAYRTGADDYITKPFHEQEVLAKVRTWLRMVHRDSVEGIWREAERARTAVGSALVTLARFRDTETGDHLFRMRWYSQALAEQLSFAGPYCDQIDERFLRDLYRASPLHDIGKVAIDDAILRKPGPLTDREFAVLKQHTVIGHDILLRAFGEVPDADYVHMAAEIARHHHERVDGAGYPDGLCGSQIPLAARIVAVADAFDAVTTQRVYRAAQPIALAVAEIERGAATRFDPIVVAALLQRIDDFQQAHSRFADGYLAPAGGELIGNCDRSPGAGRTCDHAEYVEL